MAINVVVNYEEGAEYSLPEDGVNDSWGEYSFQFGPEVRDLGTEGHFEYGSRVGIWRLCRLFDEYRVDIELDAFESGAPVAERRWSQRFPRRLA